MFGKYRAIKEIGSGATSVVYLAEEDTGQPRAGGTGPDDGFPELSWGEGPVQPRYVAIKVVDFTDDRSKLSRRFRKLFATEAAVTAQFDHPNIAKVHEWKVEEKRAYLVMEYVEGTGLDHFVTMDRLLPMHKVVGIIFKLAMALDYAHRRGIVHRDIKPANVLLSKDDEVKLMDFGLALNIKKNVNVDSTFINGLGSPSYMSPEQIKGYTLNHQTDLYSLGVMFYQMLTGRLPFRAPSTSALVYKIINTEAVAVTQLNPDIPDLSDKVIKKALEKDLYSRYRLGADMAKDLSAVRYQILDDRYIAPDDSRWRAVRGLPILGALDDVDVWELLRLSAWRVLQPSTVLMTEGEAGKSFGFILEGEMEVEKGERAIAKLSRGDIVGEIAYLDGEGGARSATVTALNRVTFLEVNPSAFAFATEELREEIHRIATNAMVKRLRAATTLAKRASPLAVHPAAATGPEVDVEVGGMEIAPDKALGWGAFAKVAAAITEAPATSNAMAPSPLPTPAAAPAAPVPVPPAAAEPATARAPVQTARSPVLVQPLPAAAAAMIAQMALGNQVMGKSAPLLQPFDLGPETPDDEPTTPVSQMPPDAVLTTELGAHFGGHGQSATTELAANFDAPPIDTSEIAPDFDLRLPKDATETAANYDSSQQLSTSELAPSFDRSQDISTTDLAPRFDRSQQISTSDLAPRFDSGRNYSPGDMAPRFESSPLLTTEMAAQFDAPPPSPMDAPINQRPLRPPVREYIQDSTQALAPEFASGAPPAYPGQSQAAFDTDKTVRFNMDKTVQLSGGFKPDESDRTLPEEQLGILFPPLEDLGGTSTPAPATAPQAPAAVSAQVSALSKTMPPAAFKAAVPGTPARPAPPLPRPAAPPPPGVGVRPAPAAAAALGKTGPMAQLGKTGPTAQLGKTGPMPLLGKTSPQPQLAKTGPQSQLGKPGAPMHKPAQQAVFMPAAGAAKPGAGATPRTPGPRTMQPEDFDKTVMLTGGFEAQPPEEEEPPFDDLFPPVKF